MQEGAQEGPRVLPWWRREVLIIWQKPYALARLSSQERRGESQHGSKIIRTESRVGVM